MLFYMLFESNGVDKNLCRIKKLRHYRVRISFGYVRSQPCRNRAINLQTEGGPDLGVPFI